MGLFGGSAKTTTTVAPSAGVDKLLQQIASMTNNMDVGSYINHQLAGFNGAQNNALDALSQNTALNQVSGMYGGRAGQGINQMNDINQMLQGVANNGVTGQNVNDFKNNMLGSQLNQNAITQGTNAGGAVGSLGGGAAVRAANRANTGNIAALTNNSRGQQMQGLGAQTLLGNNAAALGNANLQGAIAGQNIGLGQSAASLGQQAMKNQLAAGGLQQSQSQAQMDNDWQNSMGAQQFDWNQLNNKLNVLNTLSPMAGYTTTGMNSAAPKGQQMLGAGMTGLGIYGGLGGFAGGDAQRNDGSYINQWSNNGQGGGWLGSLSSLFGGGK